MKRWPTKPLGKLIAIEKGKKTPEAFAAPTRTSVRYLQIEDLRPNANIKYCEPFNCPKATNSDAIIAWDGANAGTVSCNLAGHIGSTLAVLRPIAANTLSPAFLSRFLEGNFDYLQRTATGATIPHVSKDALNSLQIPVPPLAEQERIVKLLDEGDELRKLRAQADRRTADLILALFHKMFGDPVFPKVALRELATQERNSLTNGPFGSDLLSSELTDSGVPVIYIRDISSGNYERKSTVCVMPAKATELDFCNAKPGDVLVAKVGSPPGIAAVYPAKEPHAIVTQDVIRIRPNVELALPVYVEGFLKSSLGLGEVRNITIQATRQRFSLGQFKEIKVPLPPLSLQKEFAARVSEIRAVQAEQAASRRRLDDLFQSMLHRAFKGEL